ncbi:MAG: N-acetyl-gamma-glutamyl-phosphate reductase [Methanospirillum sp.]|nr:N-acetyl-gamma-glutamyl-phosphate reductase [Methanospirillum sp.]
MEIAIVGASGYAGGELVRLLASHSSTEVTVVTSRKHDGTPLTQVHPHLAGFTDLVFSNPDVGGIEADFAFLAVPHTAAMRYARPLLDRGIRVVDLSADYRLPKEVFEAVYAVEHTDWFAAPYGIPELRRDAVVGVPFVSNPGCFPTGATLAAAPLASFARTVVYDSKTGVSGAGDNPSAVTHYPNVGDTCTAYKWTGHRHLAEMRQELAALGSEARCYFTPHLLPVNRGILTTAHILLREPMEQEEVEGLYRRFYAREPFVRYQPPSLSSVRGSNYCDLAVEVSEDRAVVVSAIDNLVKGAAGQAIQNMNLMCGYNEDDGLRSAGVAP